MGPKRADVILLWWWISCRYILSIIIIIYYDSRRVETREKKWHCDNIIYAWSPFDHNSILYNRYRFYFFPPIWIASGRKNVPIPASFTTKRGYSRASYIPTFTTYPVKMFIWVPVDTRPFGSRNLMKILHV